MQYARRQRAKGRRPLINSAALPGQKAVRADLFAQPPTWRSAIEITALFGALSITRQLRQSDRKLRPGVTPGDERTSPVVVSASRIGRAASGVAELALSGIGFVRLVTLMLSPGTPDAVAGHGR
jgi:hypothetical protein